MLRGRCKCRGRGRGREWGRDRGRGRERGTWPFDHYAIGSIHPAESLPVLTVLFQDRVLKQEVAFFVLVDGNVLTIFLAITLSVNCGYCNIHI
jgi:hypothetical protein